MTVVGLHPEELFDKLLDGEITPAEHERLRQHLRVCDVCRFEWAARGDFQQEALGLSAEPPPLLPLRPPAPPTATPTRRRRGRIVVWGLAAAALITASGAVASSLVGGAPWPSLSSVMFSQANTPASQPAPGKAPPSRTGCKGAGCATDAPSGAAPSTVVGAPPMAATPTPVVIVPARAPERQQPAEAALAPAPPRTGSPSQAARSPREAAASGALQPVAAPNGVGPELAKEPLTAAKLFADANQARRAGDVGRASGLYRLLQEQFPSSAEAELSRVTMALLLLDSGDAQNALAGFERYLAGSSRGLEAEALVGRARALGRLGRRDLEAFAWQEVQRKYPRSIYGRQATERLAALGQP